MSSPAPRPTPNIIYILADDMGFGDLAPNNPASKIPTPNLTRLADRGMRFTDAHAASAVCTPSRYNLLTGRYCWRSRLKQGVLWDWDLPLIEPGRLTAPGFLKQQGYATHCIGKWHLGWEWITREGTVAGEELPFGEINPEALRQRQEMGQRIDYSQRMRGGPVDHGFDTYFGIDVPNFPPYTWFEDDHVTAAPTVPKPPSMFGFAGDMLPDWSLEAMLPELTRRAVGLIERESAPFFLYFPLTAPHSPIVPNKQFEGMSGAGKYGDFVCEVDWVVGEITAALERSGKADDTLIIFTSDNGPEPLPASFEGTYEMARGRGHYSMGPWRGVKRDIWEGGHRVPFLASWPGHTPAGSVCDQLVCLGDFLATCAEITGAELPSGAGEDSISMLPLLEGKTDLPTREEMVYHSCNGNFAIRNRDWVFIDAPSGGDNPEPEWFTQERGYTPHDFPGELYRLTDDPTEATNLYGKHPEIVSKLAQTLAGIKNGHAPKSTAPGALESE